MKKLLKIFLISLTFLTFSNTASGGFFGDFFEDFFGDFKKPTLIERRDVNSIRCKVEYNQLDLITGTENIYKDTSQFAITNHCEEGLERLSKKVYKWVDERNTNIITKINAFKCKIKIIHSKYFTYIWSRYRDCGANIQKLSAYLVNEYHKQIGAKIYKNSIAD
jgi:hypothetical protein